MRAIDECQHCPAKAEISFGGDEGSRLTLIYWTCRKCGNNNVSAFDWELRQLPVCAVMVGAYGHRSKLEEAMRQQRARRERERR